MGKLNPWKDEGDEDTGPRIGRDVRAWFGRRLDVILNRPAPWGDVTIEEVVSMYYMDKAGSGGPECFLDWEDSDEYRGKGWSNGFWAVDVKTVLAELPYAIHYVRRAKARALDAQRFPTLDEWLDAEARGNLADKWGAPGAEPITTLALIASDADAGAPPETDPRTERCRKCKQIFTPQSRRQCVCISCLAAECREHGRAIRGNGKPTHRGVYMFGGGKSRYLSVVNSKGEIILQKRGVDAGAKYRAAVADSWAELDKADPLPTH